MSSQFYNANTPTDYVTTNDGGYSPPPADPTIATASQSAAGLSTQTTLWGAAVSFATFGLWNPDAASTGGTSAGSSSQQGRGILGSLGDAASAPIQAVGADITAVGDSFSKSIKAAVPETVVIVVGVALVAFAAVYITYKVKA